MNVATLIRSLKLFVVLCFSIGLGFSQPDSASAQSRFGPGGHSVTIERGGKFKVNKKPAASNAKSSRSQVLDPINADPNFKDKFNRNHQTVIGPGLQRELIARQRAIVTANGAPFAGVPSPAIGSPGYPPTRPKVSKPPQQEISASSERGNLQVIRSPFANFSTKISTIASAHPYLLNAETNFKNGEYQESRCSLEQALKNDPNNGSMIMFATMNSIAVRDYPVAGELFTQATQILNADQWNNVFKNYNDFYGNDDFKKHVADFFEFSKSSDNVDARRLRGFLAYHSGNWETAQSDLDYVLKVEGDDPVASHILEKTTSAESVTVDSVSNRPTVNPAKLKPRGED